MSDFRKSNKKKGRSEIRQLGLLGTIPILLAVGPLVGFFIGRWLDEKLGTEPFLLVLFLIFGFIASGREIYRLLKRAEDEEKKEKDEKGN
ncbi:MAG: AtpZ/AtpI family protein [candidate division Zixibacteria bacterium]|nr:AtpZ/AtpI family protein [candidate division Zixibacteria bacterium]